MSGRRTNAAGIALIKHYEGYSAKPYICPAGYWTIGYGALKDIKGAPVNEVTPPINKVQAEMLLKRDLRHAEGAVNAYVRVPLTDNQFSALVSFVYNLGAARLKASTLLRMLNAGDYEGAEAQFRRWVYAGANRLPGLIRRREAESSLFSAVG